MAKQLIKAAFLRAEIDVQYRKNRPMGEQARRASATSNLQRPSHDRHPVAVELEMTRASHPKKVMIVRGRVGVPDDHLTETQEQHILSDRVTWAKQLVA
jgi:hypothetical protein